MVGGPAGDSPYYRVLELVFSTFDLLDAALTSPEGVAAGKDLMDYAGEVVELLFVEASDELTDKPLGPDNLQAYLNEHNIPAEIVYPGAPTPTVPAAAEALGVDADQIVKSVLFWSMTSRFWCTAAACAWSIHAAGRPPEREPQKVKLANADRVLNLTGYAVGTVPPVGLKTPIPLSWTVLDYPWYMRAAAGSTRCSRSSQVLQRVSRAEVAPMQRRGRRRWRRGQAASSEAQP